MVKKSEKPSHFQECFAPLTWNFGHLPLKFVFVSAWRVSNTLQLREAWLGDLFLVNHDLKNFY